MAKRFVLSTGGFTGLDERAGSSTTIKSLPKLVNMRVNESGALEKRCGFGLLCRIANDTPITAIWQGDINGQACILAACGNAIYISVDEGASFNKLADTKESVKSFIPFGGKVYCLGGGLYCCTNERAFEVEGYVPTVATSCSMGGKGTALEPPNMLNPKRRVLYNGDGINVTLSMPEKNIASVDSLYLNGKPLDPELYLVEGNSGIIEFDTPPEDGLNNIEIYYSIKNNDSAKEIISGFRYAVAFENRLFLYGNPEYPDRVYHSEMADGIPSCEYFSELGYHAFDKDITSLIPCYNRLLVFSEDSACFMFAELKTDSLGNTYTSFPVYELHSSKGNIALGLGCSVENTPITICRDGLNRWVSTAIADERSAKVFSERAFKFMAGIDKSYTNTLLFNRKASSELWLCTSNGTLIYNYALDCFYIYSLTNVRALYEVGSDLLLGTSDGEVCLFSKRYDNDAHGAIVAEFETPYCTFGAPYSVKSLYSVSVSLEGQDELYADLLLYRGNQNYTGMTIVNITLPTIPEKGFRKIQKRVNLKRFFSAKLKFTTESNNIAVTDLHLFGKQHDGAIRIN